LEKYTDIKEPEMDDKIRENIALYREFLSKEK